MYVYLRTSKELESQPTLQAGGSQLVGGPQFEEPEPAFEEYYEDPDLVADIEEMERNLDGMELGVEATPQKEVSEKDPETATADTEEEEEQS